MIQVLRLENSFISRSNNLDLTEESQKYHSSSGGRGILVSLYEFVSLYWPNIRTVIICADEDKLFMTDCLNIISGSFPTIKSLVIKDAGNITGLHLWISKKHPKLSKLELINTHDSRLSFVQLFDTSDESSEVKKSRGTMGLEHLVAEKVSLTDAVFEKLALNGRIRSLVINESNFESNFKNPSEVKDETPLTPSLYVPRSVPNRLISLKFCQIVPVDLEYRFPMNSLMLPKIEEFVLECDIFPHDGHFFDYFFKEKHLNLKKIILPTINDSLALDISENCPNLTLLTVVANGGHCYENLDFSNSGLNSLFSNLPFLTNIEISTKCFTSRKPFSVNDGLFNYYNNSEWKLSSLTKISILDAYFSPQSISTLISLSPSLRILKVSLKNNKIQLPSPPSDEFTTSATNPLSLLALCCSTNSSFERLANISPYSSSFEKLVVYYRNIKSKYAQRLENIPNLHLRRISFC
ncbi:hypothetical protein AYI68_g361 [Smittium mucronatum]|uniref:Uncharacterized protein n=1 Tax=Smittium mucronatum TaxID=133383 RepID=A0A1R0H8M3_9FUNG|nr:hypothetical protein AYI68_g361 [Smittium mucronatum]